MYIALDEKGGRLTTHKNSLKEVQNIINSLDLIDIWRVSNPDIRRFTWRRSKCENRFCLHKRENWRTGKNSKTLWERPFPGDTRWLREGTESLTPAEYPWDNDYNRTWVQRRSLIQDYTAGRVRNITKENLTKHRCKYSKLMTRYRLGHVLAR